MIDKATKNFIMQNLEADVSKLLLKGKIEDVDVKAAAGQIHARQKSKSKLPFLYNDPDIVFPAGLSVEQSSSYLTAEFKAGIFTYDSFCDLTGGFGIDSMFFAKNCSKGVFIESNPELIELAKHNFNVLGINNVEFENINAEEFLKNNKKFDLIYVDPSRRKEGSKVFRLEDCEPDVTQIFHELQKNAENIIIKVSPMLDINAVINDLPQINHIKIISVENECKEMLLIYEKDREMFTVEAVELSPMHAFEFEYVSIEAALSLPLTYLYEPNVALMKSGGADIYAQKYNLKKLHKFTHLYTSDELLPNYLGRAFIIKDVIKYSKKELNKILKAGKANVAVRNFPDSPEQIKKRLKIKDGGNMYIFAATDINENKILILCEKA